MHKVFPASKHAGGMFAVGGNEKRQKSVKAGFCLFVGGVAKDSAECIANVLRFIDNTVKRRYSIK